MVQPNLVNLTAGTIDRSIFVDDAVYREELERIFARMWLFVGHESQIPNAGDFFVSRMGAESVILCRDRELKIHVFLNTCRHRGMKVCRYDEGNTPLLTCPYHAWSYSLDGKLAGVPMYNALYEGSLDKTQWGLIEVALMVNYKGTIWATWDPAAPSFETYLGGAKLHLDYTLDARDGREGGSEAFAGVMKWIVPSNWKFGAENFLGDTYHNISHRSVDLVGIGPSALKGARGRRDVQAPGAQELWINFAEGHGVHSALTPADNEYVRTFLNSDDVEDYFRNCFAERKRRLGERSRMFSRTGTIFPNTSYHGQQPRALFVWHPHSATSMEIWRVFLVDRDAPDLVKDFLRHYYMRYSGPAGMTEQDDCENWNYATAASNGTIAKRYPYNYQQSLADVAPDDAIAGSVSRRITEGNARNFYRRWDVCMTGDPWKARAVAAGREG